MRKILTLLLLLTGFFQAQAQLTFHDYTVISIAGDTVPLSTYAGKKVLVVNTASFCGYTYELSALQQLDSTYSQYNFEVVGFPCNDFGGQEPANDSTIAVYYGHTFGVGFDLMHKISITSTDTAPVYKWLQRQDLNGVANAPVSWNFNKFCIDEAGHWVRHFDSPVQPLDTAITNWIMSASVLGVHQQEIPQITCFYDPSVAGIRVVIPENTSTSLQLEVYDVTGRLLIAEKENKYFGNFIVPVKSGKSMCVVKVKEQNWVSAFKVLID